jgi:hypothetical protein
MRDVIAQGLAAQLPEEIQIMDWLPKLLDFVFVAGQVSAGLYLAYGAYLFVRCLGLPLIRDEGAASGITFRHGQPALA